MSEHVRADRAKVRALIEAVTMLRVAEARFGRTGTGLGDLNSTDRSAMRYVCEGGHRGMDVTPGMLAARLHLSPSSVTTLLRRLAAKRLISVEPSFHDRRSKRVLAFDRTLEADEIDPLAVRLREISASLTSADARVVTAYVELVTEAVRGQTLRLAR